MKKKYVIPVFVPHLGCPNDCVFCNQKSISGQKKNITKEDAKKIIDEFLEEIHKVRKQGYALDENEYDHGIICISIPIYNSNGKIDFTMSVTDLILYTKAEELINLKDQLDEVSRKVSNAINYI